MVKILSISKKINYTEYKTDDFLTADKVNEIQQCIQADESAIEEIEGKIQQTTSYSKDEIDDKLSKKVDVVDGKNLSTNDYTNEDKAEVEKIKDKQDKLIFDDIPTKDSTNAITSGAVEAAITAANTGYTKQEVDSKLDEKVDKITGKDLSTNDYTNDDKAEVAKIKDKQNKLIYDEVPTADSTNSLTSGAIYSAIDNINTNLTTEIEKKVNKATTIEGYGIIDAYTKSEIDSKIVGVYKICGSKTVEEINAIEASTLTIGDVYNVSDSGVISTNIKVNAGDNVVWTEDGWDNLVGIVDLSSYQEKLTFDDTPTTDSENPVKSNGIATELNKKVDKITGKVLSTNDYTNDDKAEVAKIKDKQNKLIYDEVPTADSTNSVTSGVIYKTVNGLAESFNEVIETKVDKEENKGLSTNDYTNEEKAEVAKVKDKQDILTFDDVPTVDSNNPVKSSGIKTAINDIKIELSTEIDKKATKATTIEGYGITDAYTKSEVDSKIVGVYKICGSKTVEEISTIDISTLIVGDVYNISNSGIVGTDVKVNAGDNIVWTEDGWDNLSGIVDLSNYQEKLTFDIEPTEDSENMVKSGAIYAALRKKVDKSEENKGLSTNDYTNEEKAEVAKIKDKQDTLIFDDEPMENSENPVKSKGILTAINNLITDITNKLLKKVDVIEGKQLSTNDYTDDDKAEVAKIKDKQDTLVFDETPTKDSTNVITSGAVAKALEGSGGTSLAISGEGANSVVINNADTNTNSVKGAGSISIGNANTILSSNARAFGGNIWIGQAGYLVMGRKSNNVFYLTDVSAFSTGTMVLVYTYFTQGGFFNSPIVDEVTAVDTTNKTITLKNTTTLTAQKDYICKCGEKKDGDQIFGGKNATAEGNSNFVSGNAAHAEGSETAAYGYYSHSEGVSTKAYGQASHVENSNTKAYGNYSHAEGMYTTANGSAAHSEGTSTKANGTNSHAEGNGSVAEGEMSHAQNQSTIANGNSQTAIGKFNIADTTNLFIIGKGTSDSARANALTVNQDGSLWVSGNLRIGGESFSGVGDDGRVLTFGTDDSYYDWRFKKLEARLKALDNQDPDYSRQAKRDEDFDNL